MIMKDMIRIEAYFADIVVCSSKAAPANGETSQLKQTIEQALATANCTETY